MTSRLINTVVDSRPGLRKQGFIDVSINIKIIKGVVDGDHRD